MSCCEMPTVLICLGSARTPQKRMRVNKLQLFLWGAVNKWQWSSPGHLSSLKAWRYESSEEELRWKLRKQELCIWVKRQKRYVKLGFSQLKKVYDSVQQLLIKIHRSSWKVKVLQVTVNSKWWDFLCTATDIFVSCATYFANCATNYFDTRMLWGASKMMEVGGTGGEKSTMSFTGSILILVAMKATLEAFQSGTVL